MRVTIRIDTYKDRWEVTISCPRGKPDWPLRRVLCRVASRIWYFPLPKPEDLALDLAQEVEDGGAAASMPDGLELDRAQLCELCVDVAKVRKEYDNIARREPSSRGIEQFGRYLFNTLIGARNWQKIQDAANGEDIELALAWAPDDNDLHRLNWEMMYCGPNRPLAAEGIAITRLVLSATAPPQPLGTPPRLLFVVGTSLIDRTVRPGAEFYGLLRQLRTMNCPRALHTWVIQKASPQSLTAAMKRFQPDIVHFICHGEIDSTSGKGFLELQLDENETDERLRQRSASQLIHDLTIDGQLPSIVILSACNSGVMLGVNKTAPLAAELVQLGIPIVIGMAGRVSSLACRMFTRQVGQAIVQGKPIVKATAEGRQAVLNRGLAPDVSVDWALPSIYMAENVPADFASTPYEMAENEKRLNDRLKVYDVERNPVFCDRDEFYEAYYRLFAPGKKPVLIAYGESGMGKTRLLQELTAQAVRDGHIPLSLLVDKGQREESPYTMAELIDRLWHNLKRVYTAYGVPTDANCQLRLLAKSLWAQLERSIEDEIVDGKPGARAVQLALQYDLYALKASIQAEHPEALAADACPVVMLDSLHRYPDEFVKGLFEEDPALLGHFGLGTPGAPIPVVITFALSGPYSGLLKEVVDSVGVRPWMDAMPLMPFRQDNDGDMFCYERVLLHPFNPTIWKPYSEKPYVIKIPYAMSVNTVDPDQRTPQERVYDTIRTRFRRKLQGIPRNLEKDDIYLLVETSMQDDFFAEADDDDLMKQWMHEAIDARKPQT